MPLPLRPMPMRPTRSPNDAGTTGFLGGPDMRPQQVPQAPLGFRPMRDGVLGTLHKGGKVRKSGLYRLKKGEHVVPLKSMKNVK